jgi:hypothetical protein
MKVKEYIESVEADSSQELLINTETGEIWGVDKYALRERGYPDGGWMLLDSMDKADLVVLIYKMRGVEEILK